MFSMRFALFFAIVAWLASFAYAQDTEVEGGDISYEGDIEDGGYDHEGYSDRYPHFKKVCGTRVLLIKKELPYRVAQKVCYKLGGRLLAVNSQNFDCFAWFLNKIGKSPVWIGSWNGDNYKNKGIALYAKTKYGKGAIAVPSQKRLFALCEKREHGHYTKPKKTETITATVTDSQTATETQTETQTETLTTTVTSKKPYGTPSYDDGYEYYAEE